VAKISIVTDKDDEGVANFLAARVQHALDDYQNIVWFVSGGSSVSISAKASGLIRPNRNLKILLADERYGPIGHLHSNWNQLLRAGFSTKVGDLFPVLKGEDLGSTAKGYEKDVTQALHRSDYKIALLGMGADGHTAGVLPYSEAVSSQKFVYAYNAPDYQRLTLTLRAIEQLDEAVVYAYGSTKWQAIKDLAKDLGVDEQLVQILKKIPKVTLFSDIKDIRS